MSPEITFLLTLLLPDSFGGHQLAKVALKFSDRNGLPGDLQEYPMEPEHRAFLKSKLPTHCQHEIVAVEWIYDSIESNQSNQ